MWIEFGWGIRAPFREFGSYNGDNFREVGD
jgi:hypothetical protein